MHDDADRPDEIEVYEDVPDDREERIKALYKLPSDSKRNLIPPVGTRLKLGAFTFEVDVSNSDRLRFAAKLYDVNTVYRNVVKETTNGD